MRKLAALLLFAVALPGAAQTLPNEALRARPAAWTIETVEGQQVLRGATIEDPGDRLLFACNNERRLVAMVFMLSDDPQVVVDGAGQASWVIDGGFEPASDASAAIRMGRHVMAVTAVAPPLFRRLLGAGTAGFGWYHRDDRTQFAGFQIEMTSGRAQFAAFARACNAEVYP